MILAQSATRNIGIVILAIVLLGFLLYVLFNMLDARGEGGSEIELAANRKEYHEDDVLETRILDLNLTASLVLISVIGIALPLYWLGEPGRQEGLVDHSNELWTEDGAEAFEETCSSCHGGGGAGGIAPYAVTTSQGEFVASVDWVAPSLTSVLTRFDEDEVRFILNWGRNGVMPAWGAPGGGPLTVQQIDIIITYLRSIQKDGEAVQDVVNEGLIQGARDEFVAQDPALSQRIREADNALTSAQQSGVDRLIEEAETALSEVERELGEQFPDGAMAAYVDQIASSTTGSDDYLLYGKLLFTNRGDSGAYGCARCHTNGWSYDGANDLDIGGEPLNTLPDGTPGHVQGGGWFGPNLTAGATVRQFPNEDDMVTFIQTGSGVGTRYGVAGQGDGQMPGFGVRVDDDLLEIDEFGEEVSKNWPASLTEEQIRAIVAYERSL
jgi:mono/diheme cytochrome c family protein